MLIKKRNNIFIWGSIVFITLLSLVALLFLTAGVISAQSGLWEASYWNNPELQGNPTLVRMESAIAHDWEGLSPDPSIQVDNFSARWIRTAHFEPGTYRFKATMDDGMRVWVDGKEIINDWREGKVRTNEADVLLSGGSHTINVEYFEKGGVAIAGFTWSQISGGNTPEYGQPMPPEYGQPMPPEYGQPMPPEYGQPMPPEYGQPMPPVAGQPMPPVAGQPMPPVAGQPMPPVAGQPMPPGYGQPMPPGKPVSNEPIGFVKTSFLNVRQGPSASYASIAVLPKGTEVKLIGRNYYGTWLEVMNAQGSRGWVNEYYILTKYETNTLPVTSGNTGSMEPRGMVNVANLNVRYGPGTNFGVFAIIHQGQTVSIIGRDHQGAWLKVRISSGAEGWVRSIYITGDYSMQHLPVLG